MQTTGVDTDAYRQSLARNIRLGATEGIDAALEEFNLDALVLPSEGLSFVPAALAGSVSNSGLP